MKGANDSKPWVPIVVGILGVLAGGLAVRQCGSSPAPESAAAPQLARIRPAEGERGGWIAQSQTRPGGSDRSRPADVAGGRVPSRDADTSDFAPPRRGGARDVGERDFRDTDTVDTGGDDIAAQPHMPSAAGFGAGTGAAAAAGDAAANADGSPAGNPAGAPPPAPKPAAEKPATAQTEQAAPNTDPAKAGTAENNGPVLSLPLDGSTTPDKGGDNAPIIANGVTFDQNGAHFSSDAQLFIPSDGTVNAAAGTFNFWMLPDWAGDVESKFQVLHLGNTDTWANRFDIFKDLAFFRLLMCTDSGFESGAAANISGWKKGDRHMITTTWGDGVVAMYIDGVAVGASDYDGQLDIGPNPPLFLGSGNPRVREGANSNIRNFQIYTRSLNPDEITNLYAQPPS